MPATPPTAIAAAPTARRGPRHVWRWALVALVVVAVLNLGVILLAESDTTQGGRTLPQAIDSLTPNPGELIGPQDTIGADLRNDLTGVLVLDGAEIPEDQLERVIPLAQVTFRPGPDQDLRRFDPGQHTLVVYYWPQGKERPARPTSYSWSFRVGA